MKRPELPKRKQQSLVRVVVVLRPAFVRLSALTAAFLYLLRNSFSPFLAGSGLAATFVHAP